MKRNPAVKPLTDPDNALGRAYAEALRTRAKAVLASSTFPLGPKVRSLIAADLEALAVIAEKRPDAFGALSLTDMPTMSDDECVCKMSVVKDDIKCAKGTLGCYKNHRSEVGW